MILLYHSIIHTTIHMAIVQSGWMIWYKCHLDEICVCVCVCVRVYRVYIPYIGYTGICMSIPYQHGWEPSDKIHTHSVIMTTK